MSKKLSPPIDDDDGLLDMPEPARESIADHVPQMKPVVPKEPEAPVEVVATPTPAVANENEVLYVLRTTANREEQVVDFVASNASKRKLGVYSIIHPHGMRGYVFLEAVSRSDAEQACFNIPYARGILPATVKYKEIEHMLEQVKKEVNIKKNDIVEIISGPFKREKAKITRLDMAKEEAVVELLESAVPIPITLKIDAVKVIRRDDEEKASEEAELDDFS
jgi:transcription termination/antitermination protein NusG